VCNHAGAMLASDFLVTITARFRTLYVLVVLDVGTRRIVHWNQIFTVYSPGQRIGTNLELHENGLRD